MKNLQKFNIVVMISIIMSLFLFFDSPKEIHASNTETVTGQKIITQYKGIANENLINELTQLVDNEATASAINIKIQDVVSSAKNKEKYNFQLISDIHMSLDNSSEDVLYGDTYQYFVDTLEYIATKYSDTSAVLVPGDITCNGIKGEFEKYAQAINRSYDEFGLPLILTSIGNHEYYNEGDVNNTTGKRNTELTHKYFFDTLNEYYNNINYPAIDKVYYDTYIGGNHFIVLGSEQDGESPGNNPYCYAYISDEQLNWFEEKLAETNPNEPIFIMLHQPLDNTVYFSDTWGAGKKASDDIKSILSKYPQAIVISGHVHNGYIGDEAFYPFSFGTCLDMPAFQYNDIVNYKSHLGYNAAVYEDRIIFTPINFDKFIPLYNNSILINRQFSERLTSYYDLTPETTTSEFNVTTLNFGNTVTVDGLRIIATNGSIENVKIETSSDGINYTQVYNGICDNFTEKNKIYFKKTDLSYIKCTIISRNGNAEFIATWYGEDKSKLRKLYLDNKNFDTSLYTEENLEKLRNAIISAKQIIEKYNATFAEIQFTTNLLEQSVNNTINNNYNNDTDEPIKDNNIIYFLIGGGIILLGVISLIIIINKKVK
jgi:3',5'-cyclic AMP phosphodiesterase CpdA